jgi:hypothetical protein
MAPPHWIADRDAPPYWIGATACGRLNGGDLSLPFHSKGYNDQDGAAIGLLSRTATMARCIVGSACHRRAASCRIKGKHTWV